MINENKQENRISAMKASVTVETTLIMPVVLACIILLIILNGYLHDIVVLNGISLEVLYAESVDREKLFQEETSGSLLCLSNTTFDENENPLNRTVNWSNKYSFPLKGFMNIIIEETEMEFSGQAQKQSWSMSQIIRYVDQN